MEHDAWRSEVEAEREAREAHYKGPDTPLSPENRKAFQGLRWYPIEPRWRVEAKLKRHPVPMPGRLASTGDDALPMMEVGVFELALDGHPARLLAFEPAQGEASEAYILIPFRDATSGKETYGAGRYLDVEPNAEDEYVLDFNRAYHPYCAHDDAWSCTLPPPENRLAFKVEAGERL